jgi:hypothetical protein
VDDHDLLPSRMMLQDDADSTARNPPAELDDDKGGQ